MATPAQVAANRKNAQNSTGPKSIEGKNTTRFNGLRHGLRAEQVVLPGEDRGEFEAELKGWADDFRASSRGSAALAERAAAANWRLRRCVRVENARLTGIADRAAAAHDDRERAVVAEAMARFRDDPETALAMLRSDPAGLDHLLATVDGLLADLAAPGRWRSSGQYETLMGLLGYPAGTRPEALYGAEREVARDAQALCRHNDLWSDAPDRRLPEAEAAAATGRLRSTLGTLRAEIAAEVSRHRDRDDRRALAVDTALVDDSPEGRLLHRYEMAHDRSLRATIKQLVDLAKSGMNEAAPGERAEVVANAPVASAVTQASRAPEPARPSAAPSEAERPADRPSIAPTEPNSGAVARSSDECQVGREAAPRPATPRGGGLMAA